MPITLDWSDVAIRLAFSFVAGALVGLNRGEQGRPAGFRTTILVSVAAAVAMIQANLLLATAGRKPDSFIMLDLMRLPLGILSGMGFIGAGAILRRGEMVVGVTTAATLWFVTVMGLCFGGGQLGLGSAMLVLGITVLWVMKWVDLHLVRDRRAVLMITTSTAGPNDAAIRQLILSGPFHIVACAVTLSPDTQLQKLRYELDWHARATDSEMPDAIRQVSQQAGIVGLQWRPLGAS